MKRLCRHFGFAAFMLAALTVSSRATAFAQGAAKDQSGAVSSSAQGVKKTWLQEKMAGSYAELSTFVGSGTFYTSGYRDPYVSTALYLKPVYQLGTKYELTLNGRVYLEEEYTDPANENGRHFYPLDAWLWLAAKNLHTFPSTKVRLSGLFRLVIPVSYESRYAHLLTGVGLGGSANRAFEFGSADSRGKKWMLTASLGTAFTKYIRSSELRGNSPGDTSGCRTTGSNGVAGGAPSTSESDRCGGPLSTNYALTTSINATLTRTRVSLSMTLILTNQFRYSVPDGTFPANYTVPTGRDDTTWGIIALSYAFSDHLGAALGLSSFQPALDSRYQYPRFPFFDFSGANANNYTQVFIGLNGTL